MFLHGHGRNGLLEANTTSLIAVVDDDDDDGDDDRDGDGDNDGAYGQQWQRSGSSSSAIHDATSFVRVRVSFLKNQRRRHVTYDSLQQSLNGSFQTRCPRCFSHICRKQRSVGVC